MNRSLDPIDAISLLDVAVASDNTDGENRANAAPMLVIEARTVAAMGALSTASDWLDDSAYAAAWMLAVDLAMGGSVTEFHEKVSIGTGAESLRSFTLIVAPDTSVRDWIARVDRARRASRSAVPLQPSGDSSNERAFLWHRLATNALTVESGAPLNVGVRLADQTQWSANFSPKVFDHATVQALFNSANRALNAFVTLPTQPIGKIDLMGDRDRALNQQCGGSYDESAFTGMSVGKRFADIANTHASQTALVWRGGELTYAELDRRADLVAQRFCRNHSIMNMRVGIALERSPEAIIVLIALMKCGAAYLPLDRKYPKSRLAFMLADTGTTLVVCDAQSRELFDAPLQVLDVAALCVDIDGETAPFVPAPCNGNSTAYVMYTSGSTGEPKGMEIVHRAILRLVCNVDYVDLSDKTIMLHAAPLGFDASTLEIWGPLLNGGTCVLHHESVPSGAGLAESIRRHHLTTAWLTAALFNAVVDDDPLSLRGLKQLLAGGEALSVQHVRRLQQALPGLTLINGYGPTECTTFTATYRIPAELADHTRSIPIGKPIAETSVHILNQRLSPVAFGMVGELCVGGLGLAKGYVQRPELTAERFVLCQIGNKTERLYRTGDLVRFLPDGNIEFIGRRDGQVKIRGFRIEVGEIETALARLDTVKACAVVARKDAHGGTRLIAYVVPASATPAIADLRAQLAATLPEFMVPSAFVLLAALPTTVNGKLDRRALPAPENKRPELAQRYVDPTNQTETVLCRIFADVLGLDRAGGQDNFFDLGGNSLHVMQAISALRRESGKQIAATVFFSNPTPAAIAAAIDQHGQEEIPANRMSHQLPAPIGGAQSEPIAIIAMNGRFPGAADVDAFWENLCAGRDSIKRFSDNELDPSIPAALRNDPDYVKSRGVIDNVEMFDAAFFGISPREAELMDPQQRIFMEICWECLEYAGYVPDACDGPVGVFGGMYNATYFQRHVSAHPDRVAQLGEFQVMLANEKDYVATRVANRLNLTGPAISVHTACSTSLVAIAQAVTSLRAGQCDMALAGGVSITCPPHSGYLYQEGAMLSPDGHTRTFDEKSQGTVFSDGAAVVLLKRLSDAIAAGDTISAVIRGAAVNNDGSAKASFTAPSVDGQAAVVAAALDSVGIDARSIGYVEAHGTATPLGDPVEIAALTKAYRRHTADTGFCRIGSVKSNFGHLVIAAGATGVIKTALSLAHERIPASLHYASPNTAIDMASSPFVVNDKTHEWKRGTEPRRAGVSSFGVGGTNAHAILEEAPPQAESEPATGPQLFCLSARSEPAVASGAERLAAHLEKNPDINLADAAHTLQVGRKAFAHRVGVVARSHREAIAALRDGKSEWRIADTTGASVPELIFMFPGQGAQYARMGASLYAHELAFRDAFDVCLTALDGAIDFDLKNILWSDDAAALTATAVAQPALFCIEYALARWWMSLGMRPRAMIGHSVGEYVAATLAGVFRVEDAVRLVAKRGALMQTLPTGAMLAVRAPLATIAPRLNDTLALAAENSPGLCVIAGPHADIELLRSALDAEKIVSRLLQTSHAFHSPMMDPAIAPFQNEIAKVKLAPPRLNIYSTVTAKLLTAEQACDPAYWARHLREPVRFSSALMALREQISGTLLEIGPRTTLTTLARQHGTREQPAARAIASLGDRADNERENLLLAVGKLWACGVPVCPERLDRRAIRRRVRLPAYPFERKKYWLDAALPNAPTTASVLSAKSVLPNTMALQSPNLTTLPIVSTHFIETTPNVTSMPTTTIATHDRIPSLITQLRTMLEDTSGVDLSDADSGALFVELGLDSLTLTQIAIQVKQTFKVNITFRQLMESYRSLDTLAKHLDSQMPAAAPVAMPTLAAATAAPIVGGFPAFAAARDGAPPTLVEQVIQQQMQIMAQQLALLQGGSAAIAPVPVMAPATSIATTPPAHATPPKDDDGSVSLTKYDVKKAFGAIARIHTDANTELTERQRVRLDTFMRRYIARTQKSKEYTQLHRPHLADPRVVNGFRPVLKEIIYQLVIGKSNGSRLWDLDGNEYVDVLNGFGMNLFGWQPEFVSKAIKQQIDDGYEIGPQHPLAGEVAKLVCELTGFDRAGLCNTGSEAVMGAVRIARTVTGRNTIVLFTGSYHGIFDEVIVRAVRNLRAVPAAPGIMASTAQNVLVLDYGTPESLEIIRSRADDLAAVLVEPVQSRRPDFQPREFLHELRKITEASGTLLILDEVVTGFRCHPGGIQSLFDIRADLCTYGKVMGGGFPIGVIAGKREFMDALDGGGWQYGDDSIPTVGVTYFAGTFVRHPLALAAAKAVLLHLREQGPELQATLTNKTSAMVAELNRFCDEQGAPIVLKSFASVWKTFFTEDHQLQDLLFGMMRSRGIHILDNFPCFFTTAHSDADFDLIKKAFKASVIELQESAFIPKRVSATAALTAQFDASKPPVEGARIGKDPSGKPAWFVPNPDSPGKYLKVDA